MKITLIHDECGREVLVQQILETGGHCPWDGKPFNRDYTAVLAEVLEAAQDAGNVLDNALEKIVGMGAEFRIDEESVLGPLRDHIERQNTKSPARRR